MDLLREAAPFLVGMVIPPLFMLMLRPEWKGRYKFLATFVPALIIGIITSAIAGELMAGMPDALIAVMIDTALVYTGSQVAYRLIWQPMLGMRFQQKTGLQAEVKRIQE